MSDSRPPNREGFEIAIICALPLERNAVEAFLDEDYEDESFSYGKADGDKNAYTIGRIGRQHVVIAHMPGMGTISAAAVAANQNSSFPRLKVAFVVGVCGGTPETGQDEDGDEDKVKLRLGDVIVSTQVVQIDFGRQYPDGFKRKKETEDILGRADPEIRSFVGKLSGDLSRMKLEDKTHSLSTQISLMNGRPRATYPGAQYDITYPPDHRHKHWNLVCEVCNKCESNADEVCQVALDTACHILGCQGTVTAATEEARKPAIHFGRIACGNKVIKSGVYRDQLTKQEKVIGFEMESAGTWDYVPTIVVKGVCDYADSHKNKRWQKYAALTAAACTKAILQQWRIADRREQDPSSQSTFPVHNTVPRSVNPLFEGRQTLLDDLKSIIQKALKNKSGQKQCRIVISGIGGQGKSEICLQIAHQLQSLFWGIFWVDVSTATLAENDFLNIADRLGKTVSTWKAAQREVANLKQPWLLVLDNADDPKMDYHPYFPAGTSGVVILTSRNAECKTYAEENWVDLEGLADDEARDLLSKAARIPHNQRASLEADIRAVTKLLQSHPLALIQAGSYIARGHCSIKDYPQVYERQRKRLLEFRPDQARSRYQDVYATFEASAGILGLSMTQEACDALELLPILAVYDSNQLPTLLFRKAWERSRLQSTEEIADDDLVRLTIWHLARLPIFLQVESQQWDPFRLNEALHLLKAFSLISINETASLETISMHPLVHAWARDRLNEVQQHKCWVQAACIVAYSIYDEDFWYKYARQLQSHLQATISWGFSTMVGSDPVVEICRLMIGFGWTLNEIRDDEKLLALMESLCSYLKLDNAEVTQQWLDMYRLIARNWLNIGMLKNAIILLEQIVKIEEQMPETHPGRLTSQHVLAMAYRENGQIQEAVKMIEQVVKIREQTLAETHPIRLASEHVLAMAYRDNGQIQDAVKVIEQVVKIQEQTLAETRPGRLASEHVLASIYRKNGQIREAVKVIEQVVKIREQTLAETHPERLASDHVLAMAYRDNGQIQDAVKVIEQVVKIQEQILAETHPDRLASQHELAVCLWKAGDRGRAVDLMRYVVNIKGQTLNEDHPSRKASEGWVSLFEKELANSKSKSKSSDEAASRLKK